MVFDRTIAARVTHAYLLLEVTAVAIPAPFDRSMYSVFEIQILMTFRYRRKMWVFFWCVP
jgi:hypothetical protein